MLKEPFQYLERLFPGQTIRYLERFWQRQKNGRVLGQQLGQSGRVVLQESVFQGKIELINQGQEKR